MNGMLYNRILENALLPLGDLLLGTSFMRSLQQLRSYDLLSTDELDQLQLERLRQTLQHASERSLFYRERALSEQSDPVAWLKTFPILTKQDLREYTADILTRPMRGLIRRSSSGSTGVQSSVYVTSHELSRQRAALAHWWNWGGYRIGEPMIQTGMSLPRGFVKAVKDRLFRIQYVSAFSHRREQVVRLLRSLQGRTDFYLGGYASSLYLFAKIAEQEGIEGVRLKSVIAWGDHLFPHYRSTIERCFATRVYETYGCTEGLMIAAQRDIEPLYIISPEIYLELLDDAGSEVPDGELGHVVVTSLSAKAMPLIRYRLGDLAIKLPAARYPEKRELCYPLLQKVLGRDTDIVKTRSGKYMIVHSFTGIFEHIPEIRQFRVLQRNLDEIMIEYIPDRGFQPSLLEDVTRKIHAGLGEQLPVHFKQVERIPATPSGKPQIIVSQLQSTRNST